MEGSNNFDQSRFDNHGKDGSRLEQEEEEERSRAAEKIGEAFVEAMENVRAHLPRWELLSFDDARCFYFFKTPERVSIEVTNYKPESRTERELLRSFRIRSGLSSGGGLQSEWIVNELAEENAVRFEPIILEHQDTQQFLRELQGEQYEERSDLDHLVDPTVDEMEKAAAIIEECSRRFASGDMESIKYGM